MYLVVGGSLQTEKIHRVIVQIATSLQVCIAGTEAGKLIMDENYTEIIDCFNRMAQVFGSFESLCMDFIVHVSRGMKSTLVEMQTMECFSER